MVTDTSGSWHDLAPDVAEQAREHILRLEPGDRDVPRLEPLARAAMRAIDERLELRAQTGRYSYAVAADWALVSYAATDVPADVLEAAVQLTAELYRRKDLRFGTLPDWSADGGAVRVSADQLAGVASLLGPHVEGWGLA